MKKSRLSYDEWKCILSKNQTIELVDNNIINGYVSLIDIKEVSSPQIWNFNGEDIVVCQNGYKWLSILPRDEHFCITAMMNNENEILLWYIDMICRQGLDADGIPYFDDLYLDLVVYPNGKIVEDDMDELEEALQKKDITLERFQLAIDTCEHLKIGLLSDIELFKKFTYKCMNSISK
ncbi:DUF402 domain-containing protein [Anaerosporobacter sp.]